MIGERDVVVKTGKVVGSSALVSRGFVDRLGAVPPGPADWTRSRRPHADNQVRSLQSRLCPVGAARARIEPRDPGFLG